MSVYGKCWTCGADVVSRTRGIPPIDTCVNGHKNDSSLTLLGALAAEVDALRKENERLRGMLKAEAIGALWVCPDCDIARCKHYRAALQGETK